MSAVAVRDALDYVGLLAEVRLRVRSAQARALMAVNAELIRLYWDIGALIAARQQAEGWGAAVIPRLARDLHNELPEEKGFSERNIKLMVQFHRTYPALFDGAEIGQQVVAQSAGEKGQQPVAHIPWGHNVASLPSIEAIEAELAQIGGAP